QRGPASPSSGRRRTSSILGSRASSSLPSSTCSIYRIRPTPSHHERSTWYRPRVVNVLAISALLASLVILAIGASVLLRDRTRRTYTSFAAFAFMVSAYHLCTFVAM